MSGERAERFIRIADMAAKRMERHIKMVADRYGPPPADDGIITLLEIMQHFDEVGHLAPDEFCQEPICERARNMVANALVAVSQQGTPQ